MRLLRRFPVDLFVCVQWWVSCLSCSFEVNHPSFGLSSSVPSVCFGPIAVLLSEALQGGNQFPKCSWLIVFSCWSLGSALLLWRAQYCTGQGVYWNCLYLYGFSPNDLMLSEKQIMRDLWKLPRPAGVTHTKGRVNRLKYCPCYATVSPSSGTQ